MKGNIQLVQSGISLVDQAWGGFYKGGTYLLIGPRKSGRTLIGLQYAMQAVSQKEICLYFTNMRPKDLMIHAASINFDLQSYMNHNLIVVVRVAPPADLYDMNDPDEYLVEYLRDISTVVDQFNPSRIIFDEITPYVGFSDLDLLRDTFLQMLEENEQKDITSLFIVGEPAAPVAQSIVDNLGQFVTATIYLQKKSLVADAKSQLGRMIITPNVGHTEGQFFAGYMIEPYKGIVTDFKPPAAQEDTFFFQQPSAFPPPDNGPSKADMFQQSYREAPAPPAAKPDSQKDNRYTSLANFDPASGVTEPYSFSNLYEYSDFLLLLNNQIAMYKSTGQVFNLISFKLDAEAERLGLLTVNQLQNAIRLGTDKKDKICIIEDKIIVLLIRSDKKALPALIANIQSKLPGNDPVYLRKVLQYVSVLSVEIDEKVENAEALLGYLVGRIKSSQGPNESSERNNRF